MLIFVQAVVVFENALVCYSFTVARHDVVICNVVLLPECAHSLDYHISIGKILDKKSSLVVSQDTSLHCCPCLGLLTTLCDEHHLIQTFKSGQLMLGFGIHYYSYVMGWWWDLFFRSRRR